MHLRHDDSETHHRKTTIEVDGRGCVRASIAQFHDLASQTKQTAACRHFEHHTDHFQDAGEGHDGAPRLCSPVCDCVLDKDSNCVTDSLHKLGLLGTNDEL